MAGACYVLPDRVTLGEAAAVRAQALAALRAAAPTGPWEVDAGALAAFDSSCLALLLELRRACGVVRLRAAPPRLVQLARAYGVEFAVDG
jgi:phospholipid transport system transporter-binding protein